MPLDIADPAYLEAVVTFAEREGCLDDLGDKLRWLDTFESEAPTRCVLRAAPPPYALDFVIFERREAIWRPAFVGRLTYSPRDDRAAPTFAVSISTARTPNVSPPTAYP